MARLAPDEPGAALRVTAAAVALTLLVSAVPLPLPERAAAAPPSAFVDEVVFTGLNAPTQVEFSPDGRVFVAEKGGAIKVFDNLTDTTPTLFATLGANVHNFWDRGMLGLALAPNFPADPWVYVLYTYDAPIGGSPPTWGDACSSPPGATADGCVVSGRLSRLQANGNVMTGSEQVLINDWCQQYPSHTVGDVAFGPDGALYVSGGDGASFNWVDYGQDGNPLNPCGDPPGGVGAVLSPPTAEGGALRSQDLRTGGDPVTLDGAIIRVDPATGAGLSGNPLFSSSDANARRVIAYGLRNPFRMAFRPGTSELWIGDVGWSTWEEVNRLADTTPGAPVNFGWPCYEGPGRQPGYDGANLNVCETLYGTPSAHVGPHFAYRHDLDVAPPDDCPPSTEPTQVSSSIAGLDFYDRTLFPAAYHGALFGADYSRDCIWVMFPGTGGVPDTKTVTAFQTTARNPVDLEVGPDGSLYYADIGNGAIRRIRYVPTNQPPTAVASASPTSGPAPLTVQFDASGSSDPEGGTLIYAWDLDGDGALDDATSRRPVYTYAAAGAYTARLRVTDPGGEWSEDSLVIQVSNAPPTLTMTAPANGLTWRVGDTISYAATASDAEDGNLTSTIDWTVTLHHCAGPSCHEHQLFSRSNAASGSFTAPDHEFPSYLEVAASVTDSSGTTTRVSRVLDPQTVDLSFQTQPTGLQLVFGADSAPAPFTRTVIVGSTNTVSAPESQTSGGQVWDFDAWADGASRLRTIIAPASARTFTASYTAASTGGGATVRVSDLDGDPLRRRTGWKARVIVELRDGDGDIVVGVRVRGRWKDGATGGGSCVTNLSGRCRMFSPLVPRSIRGVTFRVRGVVAPDGMVYDQALNSDPDGDSNGTRIRIRRPG